MSAFTRSVSRRPLRSWQVPAHARYAVMLWLGVSLLMMLFNLSGGALWDEVQQAPSHWLALCGEQFLSFLLSYAPAVALMSIAMRHAPARWRLRIPVLAVGILVADVAGQVFGLLIGDDELMPTNWHEFVGNVVTNLLPIALVTTAYEFYRRLTEADEAARAIRGSRAAREAELSRARLQALRAQVEPHFLFNTLANLRRLYADDLAAGRQMMDRLIEYLRRSRPSLERETITLDEDARLISAYLELHRVRMGPRLHYELDFPAALGACTLPPMLLLTLVENAIKHGLAPLPEGGFLRISAHEEDGMLHLEVADSGRGLVEGSGHGSGLANVRARLAAIYGNRAALELIQNRPRGVSALLHLPAEPATSA